VNNPEAIAARADEAARIVNSPLFNDIFDAIHRNYVREWVDLPTSDAEGAYDIHRRVKALADVKAALVKCINDGKVAAKEQSMREKALSASKKFVNRLYSATGDR
jgi:hypothetical protein